MLHPKRQVNRRMTDILAAKECIRAVPFLLENRVQDQFSVSGMNERALDPVGIAAAVLQFADFGRRLLSDTWEVYQSPSGQVVQNLEVSMVVNDLAKLTNVLTPNIRGGPLGSNQDIENQLPEICAKCKSLSNEIQNALAKIYKQPTRRNEEKLQQSTGEAFRASLHTWWREDKIPEMRRQLKTIHRRLIDAVTISLWYVAEE